MDSLFIGEIIYYPSSTYNNIDEIEIMLKKSVEILKNRILIPNLFYVKINEQYQNKINVYIDFSQSMESIIKIKEICKNYNYFYQKIKDIFNFRYVGNQRYPIYSIHLHSLPLSP